MQHLDEFTAGIAALGNADRIKHIEEHEIWISYPRAKVILEGMTKLLNSNDHRSDGNIAIVGHPGNGKSYLLDHFLNQAYRKQQKIDPEKSPPVICVQNPPVPHEGRLYTAILKATNSPQREDDYSAHKFGQVARVIDGLGIKMIMIDDVHDSTTGTYAAQKQYLAILRHLMEGTGTSLVLAGTTDLLQFLDSDVQMRRRMDVLELPFWQLDKSFRILLNSFEKQIPLRKPSNLSSLHLADKICSLSDGLIEQVWKLLSSASIYAINSGKEFIDDDVIDECGWVPLNMKMKVAADNMKRRSKK